MSRPLDIAQLAEAAGVDDPKGLALLEAFDAIVRVRVAEALGARDGGEGLGPERTIPPTRKYTEEEVRLRLYTGRDPAALSAGDRAEAEARAVSVRTIQRLRSAGDLPFVKVGGSVFVSEAQVRIYERRVDEGRLDRRAKRRGGKRAPTT